MKRSISAALVAFLALCVCACEDSNFYFNDGTVEGFTFDGIWDPGDGYADVETCTPAELAVFPTHWGDSVTSMGTEGAGSMTVNFIGSCFPDETVSGFLAFDFISPDLSGNSDWQGLTSFDFYAKTNLDSVSIQPYVKVRKADASIKYWFMVDSYGAPISFPLTALAPWTQFDYEFPAGEDMSTVTLMTIYFRVSAEADAIQAYLGPEALVQVDNIIARPPAE